jgi:hypothetical protein
MPPSRNGWIVKGRHAARYLPDIVKGNPRCLLKLEQQQV